MFLWILYYHDLSGLPTILQQVSLEHSAATVPGERHMKSVTSMNKPVNLCSDKNDGRCHMMYRPYQRFFPRLQKSCEGRPGYEARINS